MKFISSYNREEECYEVYNLEMQIDYGENYSFYNTDEMHDRAEEERTAKEDNPYFPLTH